MSEARFTPGPWEAYYSSGVGWNVRKPHELEGFTGLAPICSLAWWQFDIPGIINNEISGANARLIAAAPELLEALRLLASYGDTFAYRIGDCNPYEKAIAAIRKAEGTP